MSEPNIASEQVAPFVFRRPTTVGQLRELLADLPDTAAVCGQLRENPVGHCRECDAEPEWWDVPMCLDVMSMTVESTADGLDACLILRPTDDPTDSERELIRSHFRGGGDA